MAAAGDRAWRGAQTILRAIAPPSSRPARCGGFATSAAIAAIVSSAISTAEATCSTDGRTRLAALRARIAAEARCQNAYGKRAESRMARQMCQHRAMEEGGGLGGMFGDPDELRRQLGEMAEQMQGAQKVAWADNAIKLAVDMTVAAINRLNLQGGSDEQAVQVRDAIRIVFPEAVTLVREAREGLS